MRGHGIYVGATLSGVHRRHFFKPHLIPDRIYSLSVQPIASVWMSIGTGIMEAATTPSGSGIKINQRTGHGAWATAAVLASTLPKSKSMKSLCISATGRNVTCQVSQELPRSPFIPHVSDIFVLV